MKLKNLALLFAAGVMALSMSACGAKTDEQNAAGSQEISESSQQDDSADTQKVITNTEGKLIWATNAEFPPYEFRGDDGKVTGIDAEIAQYIGDQLGLEVEVEDMNFDSIVAAVQSGKADLGIAGMTIEEDRLASVNFSIPYVNAGQVIIVKNDSDIKSAQDLANKTIGVQLGTTGDSYVTDNIENSTPERYNKGFEAVQALIQDKVDAVVIDGEPAKSYVKANEGAIKILDEQLTEEEYAIAVNKDNESLLNAVNSILTEMKDNGKITEISNKYLNSGDTADEETNEEANEETETQIEQTDEE